MFFFPRRRSFLVSFSLTGILLLLVAISRNSVPRQSSLSSSQKDASVIPNEDESDKIDKVPNLIIRSLAISRVDVFEKNEKKIVEKSNNQKLIQGNEDLLEDEVGKRNIQEDSKKKTIGDVDKRNRDLNSGDEQNGLLKGEAKVIDQEINDEKNSELEKMVVNAEDIGQLKNDRPVPKPGIKSEKKIQDLEGVQNFKERQGKELSVNENLQDAKEPNEQGINLQKNSSLENVRKNIEPRDGFQNQFQEVKQDNKDHDLSENNKEIKSERNELIQENKEHVDQKAEVIGQGANSLSGTEVEVKKTEQSNLDVGIVVENNIGNVVQGTKASETAPISKIKQKGKPKSKENLIIPIERENKINLRKVKAVDEASLTTISNSSEPLINSKTQRTKPISKTRTLKRRKTKPKMTYDYYRKLFKEILQLNRQNLQKIYSKVPKDIDFEPGKKVVFTKVRRVLIASTWRSGSTFLGDILQSYPATFYSFEPLHIGYRNVHLQSEGNVSKALELVKDIFSCNFSAHLEYMKYLQEYQYVIEHNKFMWQSCYYNRAFCFDPKFITEVCQHIPLNVMKTVRLGMVPIGELLEDGNLDIKVIHLVRDPRGSLHSRLKLTWCISDICKDPTTVCKSLQDDLVLSEKYAKKYPNRFLIVRYEDLSLDPENVTRDILEFLGLRYHESTQKFIQDHTSIQDQKGNALKIGTYTTFRDSQRIPFAWRDSLSFNEVKIIQDRCNKTISTLGFNNFYTLDDYNNKNISVFNS